MNSVVRFGLLEHQRPPHRLSHVLMPVSLVVLLLCHASAGELTRIVCMPTTPEPTLWLLVAVVRLVD